MESDIESNGATHTTTSRADVEEMRPRFGRLTRALAVIFVITGLGATFVGLNSGSQTTPGSAYDGLILFGIGVAYLIVGSGLWMEYVWAWWAGLSLTSFVVMMDVILGIHDGGLVVWSVFLAIYAASAIQGWRNPITHR